MDLSRRGGGIYVNNISSQNVQEGKYGGVWGGPKRSGNFLKWTKRWHTITASRITRSVWLDSLSKTCQSILATRNAHLNLTRPVAYLPKSNLFHTSIKGKSPQKIYRVKTFRPFQIQNRERLLFSFSTG